MKKIIQALIVVFMLIVPALSYLDDYHDIDDRFKYNNEGWGMDEQGQQSLDYEQERMNDQIQIDALENEKRQTQTIGNPKNIMNELRGTETESQDSKDPVCPYGGCG